MDYEKAGYVDGTMGCGYRNIDNATKQQLKTYIKAYKRGKRFTRRIIKQYRRDMYGVYRNGI